VNRPGLGLPAAAQNEQTVYDIMYDINVCSCMICTFYDIIGVNVIYRKDIG
jgi:hypothetical protein